MIPDDRNCFYCAKDQNLHALMRLICKTDTSDIYLLNDQAHRGRCIVAYKKHVREPFQLSPSERRLFFEDVSTVAQAVYELFSPQKINYAIYGDHVPHLHIHIVPKHENGPAWGQAFDASPPCQTMLTPEEYAGILSKMRNRIQTLLEGRRIAE